MSGGNNGSSSNYMRLYAGDCCNVTTTKASDLEDVEGGEEDDDDFDDGDDAGPDEGDDDGLDDEDLEEADEDELQAGAAAGGTTIRLGGAGRSNAIATAVGMIIDVVY